MPVPLECNFVGETEGSEPWGTSTSMTEDKLNSAPTYVSIQHQYCWTGGDLPVSLIRKVLSRYLVSVCYIRRDYKRKWNDLSELSTGEQRTCNFYLWSKRNHWEAGKYTSALTRGSAGSYMALLPAGCSTWSRQERYRNETWGKRNGNDHKNSMRDNTWSVEGKECAHKDEEKKAKSNYLLYQGSHTPPPQ